MAITTLDLIKIEAWLLPRIAKAAKSGGGSDLEQRVDTLEENVETISHDINDINVLIPDTASESNKMATMLDLVESDKLFLASPDITTREALEDAIQKEKLILIKDGNYYRTVVEYYQTAVPSAILRCIANPNGRYIVYEYQITGENTWSLFETEIPYPTSGENVVVSRDYAISAYLNYDLSEDVRLGFWIDPDDTPKSVYRRVVNFGALPSSNSKTVSHNLPSGFHIVDMRGIATSSSNNLAIPCAGTGNDADINNIYMGIGPSNITITVGKDRSAFTRCYVFIDYYLDS